jgi:GntR family transcriptional regulator
MKLQIDPTLSIPLHLQVEKLLREYIQQEQSKEENILTEMVEEKKYETAKKENSLKENGKGIKKEKDLETERLNDIIPQKQTESGKLKNYRRGTGNGNPTKLFPKEVDLANELGVARNTVRQAISKLVHDGLLIRKKGVGTIICNKKIYTRLDNWFSFTGEMKEKGLKVVNHNLELKKVASNPEISEVFNINNKTSLLRLTRLRGTGDQPYLLSVSWFHPRFRINMDENFSMPLYKLLEEKYDIHVATSREEICAVLADDQLAAQLQVKKGVPLLFRKRSVFNSDGLIVEYNKVWYRGDGISYSLEIGRQ